MDIKPTLFPEIFPTCPSNPCTKVPWSYPVGEQGISLEQLVLSWAALLHAYTGDEGPIFEVDQHLVRVNIAKRHYSRISIEEQTGNPQTTARTAIHITGQEGSDASIAESGPASEKHSLYLRVDLETGTGVLRSSAGITPIYLHQIGLQLARCLETITGLTMLMESRTQSEMMWSIVNPVPRELPGPFLLHQLAFHRGQRNDVALEFLNSDSSVQKYSFHELDHLSTQLAQRLSQKVDFTRSHPKHRIIPVLLAQSPDLYIAWLAVLKLGAAFCPLSVDAPEDRIHFILKDVGADVVISHSAFKDRLGVAVRGSLVLTDTNPLQPDLIDWQEPCPFPEDCAYVMYTSGSTGRPKGVAISHRAATQSLLAHEKLIPPFTRFLQFASPTFDVSVFEIFFPWYRGATLIASERSGMLADLPQVVSKMQVDAAELTPTVAGELLRSRQHAPSLRTLLTIGEMLTKGVVEEFGTSDTRAGILHGMYGPTEAAIHCTAAQSFSTGSRVSLIGRPFETVSAFVISSEDSTPGEFESKILPLGQIGELVIGGLQLTTGYINRPVENSKSFVHCEKYGRLYRSGDKARILPNGDIECFGRVSKGQVKLRGQRVELGEIENVISMTPGIRSSIVGVVGGILIAWILADDSVEMQLDAVKAFCRKKLPSYMVPGEFLFVGEYPRLESGKVDRNTLEDEYSKLQKETYANGDTIFRDSLEEKISEIVRDIVGTSVGSLSAAGLDSLRAIKLASRLREIDINLDVAKLLSADSVSDIWNLAQQATAATTISAPAVDNASQSVIEAGFKLLQKMNLTSRVEEVELCSNIQEAMLLETLQDNRAYCNWIELKFAEKYSFHGIRDAFTKVWENNSTLRSAFLYLDLPDHPFCQVVWNTENIEDVFSETATFEYQWNASDNPDIIYPVKIQFITGRSPVRALIHLHHAIYDGWSWDLILNDLQATLEQRSLINRPPYSSMVEHCRKITTSGVSSTSVQYWASYLQDVAPTRFPNFHGRNGIAEKTKRINCILNINLAHLEAQARLMSISRQTFFQSSLAFILSYYLDTQDVVFGTVFSGRTIPVKGIEKIIGPCIHTLPSRVKLSWVRTVTDLLLGIHRDNLQALEHGNPPLRAIKKAAAVEGASRLFDCIIVWQESLEEFPQPRACFEQVAAADYLEFPLTIEIEPSNRQIKAAAIFDESVIPEDHVHILLQQIDAITECFIRCPEAPIDSISMRLPPESLSIQNEKYTELTNLPHLGRCIEEIATNEPTRIAIEFVHSFDPETETIGSDTLTYNELNTRSNRLARQLVNNGVLPGDLVAIISDKCIELYVAILAIIKTGAGYVPLTPSTPPDRITAILSETEPKLCLVDPPALIKQRFERLPTLELHHVDLNQFSTANVAPSCHDSNISYVVYTSGSTGKPKGVAVSHKNLKSNIATLAEIYPVGPNAKILQACSQAFDVSVFEIFFAWHTGMTLCSATNDIMFRDIEAIIRNLKITHLSLTPTVAALIHAENVLDVRFLVTAGEGLTAKVHREWADRGLYQGYGPCETTNICTVKPEVSRFDDLRNIGKPFKNTSAFVISDGPGFTLVPKGGVGEFCFGGDQVSQGYVKQEALTQVKFIDHPEFGRLYRSGDFGRMLADGSLIFTGRRDDQVKLRGQRIELGEINSILLCQSHIQDCTSLILKDIEHIQRQQLISFIVLRYPRSVQNEVVASVIEAAFEGLSAKVPPYMIPSAIIPVDEIPMTTVKKIDTKRLAEIFQKLTPDYLQLYSRERDLSSTSVLDPIESRITQIMSQATGTPIEQIRTNTSLFSMGLDSISAIYVTKQLRKSGLGQVDVSLVLRHSSIGELAKTLRRAKNTTEQSHDLDTTVDRSSLENNIVQMITAHFEKAGHKVQRIIPCTGLQEAMLSRTASYDENSYWNHIVFEFYGEIKKLYEVLKDIVRRHEILRTCFVATEDAKYSFAQVILEEISIPFAAVETMDVDQEIHQRKSSTRYDEKQRSVPYAMTAVTHSGTRKRCLLFSFHHAIHDGEAMSLLFKEIEMAYRGEKLPPPTQFSQFIDYVTAAPSRPEESFWSEYMNGVSQSYICSQAPVSHDNQKPRTGNNRQVLKISLTDFESACKEISATPLSVFQASWARTLSSYLSCSEVCFGTVCNGRTALLEGIEDIIGPCFNVLPIRVKVASAALNIDAVKYAQATNAEVMGHQHTSLRQIQKKFSRQGKPLFDSIVLYQRPAVELDPHLWKLISEEGEMDFPVILEILPSTTRDEIIISLHTDSSRVSFTDAGVILSDFVEMVVQTVRNPLARSFVTRPEEDLPSNVRLIREEMLRNKEKNYKSSNTAKNSEILSEEELLVGKVLSELSKCDPRAIKRHTTIFQLGLDSINAVQISRSLKGMGYTVSTAAILENPSLSEIVQLLHSSTSEQKSLWNFPFESFYSTHKDYILQRLNLEEQNIETIRPCSPAQSGMLADFIKSQGKLYCNRLVLKLKPRIEPSVLKTAWLELMTRHEMLRTGFIALKDAKFPFAMVTYHPDYVPLPWTESDTNGSESHDRSETGHFYNHLHLPQWHIALLHSPSTTNIELTANHAIYDAQSMELILSDFADLCNGRQLPSSPVAINLTLSHILTAAYSDDSSADSFWRTIGSEFQPTRFPNLSPAHVPNREMIVRSHTVTKPLSIILQECKDQGVSLQAVGQSAYARLLANYTGEINVSFGLVLSGRDIQNNAEEVVFPCLVTVPFSCHVRERNKDLISSVMKTNAMVLRHQFTPLPKIQKLFQQDGPLIDTLFAYQKLSRNNTRSNIWDIIEDEARVDYSLSLEMIPDGEELVLRLSCWNDVIPTSQADLILKQLDCLCLDCLFAQNSDSMEISVVPTKLLSVIPAKEKYIPSSVSLLHEFVERTAAKTPDATALEFVLSVTQQDISSRTWTYLELNSMGNKFARLLQSLGSYDRGLIGVCFEKCPEAYFAILGILKSGSAYVAIDPTAPLARKEFILKDSRAQIILCLSDRYDELRQLSGIEVISIDQPGLLDDIDPDPPILSRPIDPHDSCYCLYTSGTTGTPKGCEITHDNAVQAMQAFTRLFKNNWDEQSKWLQFASFHFDVSVLEQYWSWSVGICVTSCPRDILFQDLPGTINRLEITHIDLTPSLARLVTPAQVPSLCKGIFITGGEALKQEILDAWGKHRVIYNGYGPTEVTIGCTMLPRMDENSKSSNIGSQFDNVGSFVFKPGTTNPVLRGCSGELCVTGPLVGRGYLNRPDLNEAKFPYLDESQQVRFYRTGDLVRLLHDGTFQFNGRIDDQVKLRGQRLELNEINSVIREATDDVSEVTTIVFKHPSQQKEQLVAFVSREKSMSASSLSLEIIVDESVCALLQDIKEATQNKLPGYMVPSHFIPIVSMPLTPNNKVDVKSLKALFSDLTSKQLHDLNLLANKEASVSKEDVRDIIHELAHYMQIDPTNISSTTSIYDVGLDSISAIGFAQHLRDAGYENAQVSVLMKNPTIPGISASFSKKALATTSLSNGEVEASKQKIKAFVHENSATAARLVNRRIEDIERLAPCTPLQEGMIARFLENSRNLYCSSFRFQLKPDTDINRLRQAWSQTQANTQVLRLRLVALADGYAQIVLKDDELPWQEVAVTDDQNVHNVIDQEWQNWCMDMKDLSDSLWRLLVFKSSGRTFLCLNIFHAIYDGNSLSLLLKHVIERYHGREVRHATTSFMDVLPHGPLRMSSSAEDFWKKHLTNAPRNRFFSAARQSPAETISVTRLLKGVSGLKQTKDILKVTENAVIHSCWLLTLYKCFSIMPVVGIVVSGRALDVSGVEAVIGPLFNTIPSYIYPAHLKTTADLIKSCHQFHLVAIPFQHTPLRNINKWTGRGLNNPLFEILFVFQKEFHDTSLAAPDDIWTEIDGSSTSADYPLSLEVTQNQDSFSVNLVSQSHIVSDRDAENIVSTFESILRDVISDCMSALPDAIVSADLVDRAHISHERAVDTLSQNKSRVFDETPATAELRDALADITGLEADTVNPDVSIFEMGLDSIDAIKLSSRLKSRGLDMSVSSIMKSQTISKLSEILSVRPSSETAKSKVSLDEISTKLKSSLQSAGKVPEDAVAILPATALQESMIAEMRTSNYRHYFGVEIFEVAHETDFSKLLASWKAVINTHSILRTSFIEIDDPQLYNTYVQIVHAPKSQERITVIGLDGGSVEDIIETLIYGEPRSEFKIYGVQGKHERYIVLGMAHALYDGWSLGLLHSDVESLYYGNDVTRPSYKPFLESILNEDEDENQQYWSAALTEFQPRCFPRGECSGGDELKLHRSELRFKVPTHLIKKFCRDNGVTVQALAVTTWTIALAGFVESLDVGFGLILSGRTHTKADEVMFPTMNTVILRSILHGTRLEMLEYIQSSLNSIIDHQHYPLRKITANSKAKALFDTLFIYQRRPPASSRGKALYHSISGSAHTGYPLAVEMELVEEAMVCRVAARDDMLGLNDANRILARLDQVLHLVVTEPRRATVDFTEAGMAICGSACFAGRRGDSPREDKDENMAITNDSQSWSDTEIVLRNVLSSVSGLPPTSISKEDTLFHLGLDSISAIKVCALLKKESIQLSVSEMLKAGSITDMAAAARLEQRNNLQNVSDEEVNSHLAHDLSKFEIDKILSLNKVPAEQVERVLPVTAGQLYCLERNAQDSQVFYSNFYYASEAITKDQLNQAWHTLVNKLPILRTGFVRTGVRQQPWLQIVLKHPEKPVQLHQSVQDPEFAFPPARNSAEGPVLLHAVANGQKIMINLHIHHALYDAVSLPKLIKCLHHTCKEAKSQIHDGLDFARFISYQSLHSPRHVREEFWKSYLSGTQPRSLILQRTKETLSQGLRTSVYRQGLVSNIEAFEKFARQNGISLQSLFLAIFARIHSELYANNDSQLAKIEEVGGKPNSAEYVLGVYLANRGYSLEGVEEMISPTVNMVPLRVVNVANHNFSSLCEHLISTARQIQRDLHEISRVEHSGVSLLEINEWTGIRIDTFVNFLRLPDEKESAIASDDGIQFSPLRPEDITKDFGISRVTRESNRLETPAPADIMKLSKGNAEETVYLDCLDIEVAIREGKLDVGIFSPATLISQEQAETIFGRIQRDLEELLRL